MGDQLMASLLDAPTGSGSAGVDDAPVAKAAAAVSKDQKVNRQAEPHERSVVASTSDLDVVTELKSMKAEFKAELKSELKSAIKEQSEQLGVQLTALKERQNAPNEVAKGSTPPKSSACVVS